MVLGACGLQVADDQGNLPVGIELLGVGEP